MPLLFVAGARLRPAARIAAAGRPRLSQPRAPPPAMAAMAPTMARVTCEVYVRIDGVEQWITKPAEFCTGE